MSNDFLFKNRDLRSNFLFGSTAPFDTGVLNQLYLQFKRLAAFQGDIIFTAPRRWLLKHAAIKNKVWVSLYKRGKAQPFAGAFHSSDLGNEFYLADVGSVDKQYSKLFSEYLKAILRDEPNFFFFGIFVVDYIVSFVNTLDPNSNNTALYWPQYTIGESGTYEMLTFLDAPIGGLKGLAITLDNYRVEAMNYLTTLSLKYPE